MSGFNMAAFAGDNEDRRLMGKLLIVVALIVFAGALWLAWPHLRARLPDDFQKLSGLNRVTQARVDRGAVIAEKYRAAGVTYPGEIFVRWFKSEAVLELWARNRSEPFRRIASWPILATSGRPGPKRHEGDRQVPEGFYEIARFNPESLYHLSLGLNYPNAADRVLSDPRQPGSDIFIHGKAVSIGCAPIGDPAIEELYLAALDARSAGQRRIDVHIFPARMSGAAWTQFVARSSADQPILANFWAQLLPGYEIFERTRQLPLITVTPEGSYLVSAL